jgi:hypothetical protein
MFIAGYATHDFVTYHSNYLDGLETNPDSDFFGDYFNLFGFFPVFFWVDKRDSEWLSGVNGPAWDGFL